MTKKNLAKTLADSYNNVFGTTAGNISKTFMQMQITWKIQ